MVRREEGEGRCWFDSDPSQPCRALTPDSRLPSPYELPRTKPPSKGGGRELLRHPVRRSPDGVRSAILRVSLLAGWLGSPLPPFLLLPQLSVVFSNKYCTAFGLGRSAFLS